ncbi:hypothetical protein BD779DRAFT_780940 [Infundibulicybe gibba]|nr:hypothetical protein BD779DRAFT_780940 [Infundibulicybe gibba]
MSGAYHKPPVLGFPLLYFVKSVATATSSACRLAFSNLALFSFSTSRLSWRWRSESRVYAQSYDIWSSNLVG